MSQHEQMISVIQPHLKAKYGYLFSKEELLQLPNDKFVGLYHDALADNRQNGFYRSLEQVEDGTHGQTVYIRKDGYSDQYVWYGEWKYVCRIEDKRYD